MHAATTPVPMSAKSGLSIPLTVNKFSRLVRLTKNTVYRMIREGTVQSVRIGHQFRIPMNEVERILQGDVR
jgi:excisionase family DNA binding protein